MSANGAEVGEHCILDSEELGEPRELVASLNLFLMCRSMARSDALCVKISYTPFTQTRGGPDLDHHGRRLGDAFEVHSKDPSFYSILGLLHSLFNIF